MRSLVSTCTSPYDGPCSREHQRVPWEPVLVCRFESRKLAGGWAVGCVEKPSYQAWGKHVTQGMLMKSGWLGANDAEVLCTSGFLCKSFNSWPPSWPGERTFQGWEWLGLAAHSVPLVFLSIPGEERNCRRTKPAFPVSLCLLEQSCPLIKVLGRSSSAWPQHSELF